MLRLNVKSKLLLVLPIDISDLAVGIQTFKYQQPGRVTAASPVKAVFSQTRVRELFRMAHQVLAKV